VVGPTLASDLHVLGMSDYDFRPGGSLKLKGGVSDGGVVKKWVILRRFKAILIEVVLERRRGSHSPRRRRNVCGRELKINYAKKKQRALQTHRLGVVETRLPLLEVATGRLTQRNASRQFSANG
jgi:hypothetical protein